MDVFLYAYIYTCISERELSSTFIFLDFWQTQNTLIIHRNENTTVDLKKEYN